MRTAMPCAPSICKPSASSGPIGPDGGLEGRAQRVPGAGEVGQQFRAAVPPAQILIRRGAGGPQPRGLVDLGADDAVAIHAPSIERRRVAVQRRAQAPIRVSPMPRSRPSRARCAASRARAGGAPTSASTMISASSLSA